MPEQQNIYFTSMSKISIRFFDDREVRAINLNHGIVV